MAAIYRRGHSLQCSFGTLGGVDINMPVSFKWDLFRVAYFNGKSLCAKHDRICNIMCQPIKLVCTDKVSFSPILYNCLTLLLLFFSFNIFSICNSKGLLLSFLSSHQINKMSVNSAGAWAIAEQSHLGSPLCHIAKFVVKRTGAWLRLSKGLWTYLFFSCEPFEQTLLVNLGLSMRARGGCSHLCLSHTRSGRCVHGDPRVMPWMILWKLI